MSILRHVFLLFLLFVVCLGNETQILTSKRVPLEALLPGIHSQNRIAVVKADVDGNSHPDLLVFYATSIKRISNVETEFYEHEVRFRYRVFYDFSFGPRQWFGVDGFSPVRTTGYSEHFPAFTSEGLNNYITTSCSNGYGGTSYSHLYESSDYPYGLALTSADLDNNGRPEIIALSAVRFWGCRSCASGARVCGSAANTHRLRIQMRILWNLSVNGSTQSVSSIDEHSFNLPQGRGYSSNNYEDATPSIRVEANGCSSNSHLLVLVMGKLRTEFCFSSSGSSINIGDLRTEESQTFSVDNPTTISRYSTSVALTINNYLLHMFIDRSSKTFRLVPEQGGYAIVSNIALPSSPSSLGVVVNDFDGDGMDDFLFVDCDTEECGMRHGSLFSVATSDYNVIVHNFEEELL
ncbi:hypothetical protein RCL1_005117 [Eukaryota sp. TZLM3-RCL]